MSCEFPVESTGGSGVDRREGSLREEIGLSLILWPQTYKVDQASLKL